MRTSLLAVALLAIALHPAHGAEAGRDLRALEAEIAAVQEWLSAAGAQQQILQNALRDTETKVAQVLAQTEAISRDIPALEREIRALAARQQELAQQHQAHLDQLAQHLRAAWALGDDDWVKVALNQQDPDSLQRMLAWHGYVNRARQAAITRVQASQEELTANRSALDNRRQRLDSQRQSLLAEQQRLQGLRAERTALAASLSRDISDETRRQKSLQADHVALEQVLEQLAPVSTSSGPFAAAKGKLPWPLPTKVRHNYNELRPGGRMRWQGLLLAADAGDAVLAVHSGTVVFADWLRGYGLVLILDHGGGYMSLYAHNQRLLVATGDSVGRGQTLAMAGATGGLDQPGLYFEIRAAGTPVNPSRWLAKR